MEGTDGLVGLTLDTLGNGAADELFQHELDKVIRNIADPNTDPKAARKIMVEVTFTPIGADREVVSQAVKVTSKLAGLTPITATTYLVEKNGKPMAVGRDVRQVDAFEETDDSVRPISSRAAMEG